MNNDIKMMLKTYLSLATFSVGVVFLVFFALFFLTMSAHAEPPSAGWNFGTDTYGQHTGSLILNSLSDRYGISTFDTASQHLGTNDYIEENGVKNALALDGFTKAYDYNPNSATGYGYNTPYTTPLPNVPLTKLTFMGLDGDPTKAQDVYVLTSEYNALSAQGQAASITALSGQSVANNVAITNETTRATSAETTITNNLATTNVQVNNNTTAIANETVRAAGAESDLSSHLAVTNRQTNINTHSINVLATGLDAESQTRAAGDANLQNQVNQSNARIDRNNETKIIADMNIRLLDTKKYSVGLFDMYDGAHGHNFAFGARLTYKMGKSYEERRLDEQERKIKALEAILVRMEHLQ